MKMNVLIKGAGDLATGVACKLKNCGMNIIMTDLPIPTSVRRTVAFSRAIYEGSATVEGVCAYRCDTLEAALSTIDDGNIAVVPDPDFQEKWHPDVLIDAIIAKKNLSTSITDAPVVIALGPGFTAGKDCHCVIETSRGHYLGRCLYEGEAIPNTGIPGDIGGYTSQRLLVAPCDGTFKAVVSIGDIVKEGETCAQIDGTPMKSQIAGVVRGLLQDGVIVTKGMKSGDVDPRCKKEHCFTISDKARSVAGGALEALLTLTKNKQL